MKRRAIADAAARAGLGRVVRIHREQCLRSEVLFLPMAVLPIFVGVALLNEVRDWLALTVTYALVLWLLAGLIRWLPVPRGRHWFAVAEHGLVVWTRTPTVIRWNNIVAVSLSRPGTLWSSYTLLWSDGELAIRATSQRARLVETLLQRKAVGWPVWWLRTASTTAAAVVTLVMVTVQFGPAALDVALGEKPASVADLKRICAGGKGFGRAAAYTGPGPHPVLFSDEAKTVYSGRNGMVVKAAVPPHEVQLVACSEGVVRAPGNVFVGDCDYSVHNSDQRYVYHTYQGRKRVTVYEARTARTVASLTADGPKRLQCPSQRFVHPDEAHAEEWDTAPDDSAYLPQLSSLINGK